MKPVLVFTYNKVICSCITATCGFGALVSVYVYAAAVIVLLLVLMIMLLYSAFVSVNDYGSVTATVLVDVNGVVSVSLSQVSML